MNFRLRIKISDGFSLNHALILPSSEKLMRFILLALLVVLALAKFKNPTPPNLPDQFTAKFEEASILVVTGITEGFWYYDSVNQKEAIYRFNGRYDRYCGSVFRNQETPCRHIVTGGTFFET